MKSLILTLVVVSCWASAQTQQIELNCKTDVDDVGNYFVFHLQLKESSVLGWKVEPNKSRYSVLNSESGRAQLHDRQISDFHLYNVEINRAEGAIKMQGTQTNIVDMTETTNVFQANRLTQEFEFAKTIRFSGKEEGISIVRKGKCEISSM